MRLIRKTIGNRILEIVLPLGWTEYGQIFILGGKEKLIFGFYECNHIIDLNYLKTIIIENNYEYKRTLAVHNTKINNEKCIDKTIEFYCTDKKNLSDSKLLQMRCILFTYNQKTFILIFSCKNKINKESKLKENEEDIKEIIDSLKII